MRPSRKRIRVAIGGVLLAGMIVGAWAFVNRPGWVEVVNSTDALILDLEVSLPSGKVAFERIEPGATVRLRCGDGKPADPGVRLVFRRPGEPPSNKRRLEYPGVTPRWVRLELIPASSITDRVVICRPTCEPTWDFRRVARDLMAWRNPFVGRLRAVPIAVD